MARFYAPFYKNLSTLHFTSYKLKTCGFTALSPVVFFYFLTKFVGS